MSPSILTAGGNTVTISQNMPASMVGSNDLSGTVRVLEGATGTRSKQLALLVYHLLAVNRFTVTALTLRTLTASRFNNRKQLLLVRMVINSVYTEYVNRMARYPFSEQGAIGLELLK